MAPRAVPGRPPRRARPRDTWTLELEPVDGGAARLAAGPVHDALRVRGRRGADLGQRRPTAGRARADGARGRSRDAGRSARRSPGASSASAGRSARLAGRRAPPARDVVVVAGGIGLAPLRPAVLRRCCRAAATTARSSLLYGAGRRRTCSTARARALARRLGRRTSTHGRPRGRATGRQGRRRAEARSPRAHFDPPHAALRLRAGDHDALRRAGARSSGASPPSGSTLSLERNMQLRARPLRPLPARADADLPRRAGLPLRRARAAAGGAGAVTARKPKLAVWKFASCDGCQLIAARLRGRAARARRRGRDRLLPRGDARRRRGAVRPLAGRGLGHDRARRRADPAVRAASKTLVTIGACATAGGVQALRNFADVDEFVSVVYASPEYISTLATSTPISAHVPVDFELHGCPIDKRQLLEVLTRLPPRPAAERSPTHSVCTECKRRGTVCVTVAHGTPCLGPVTHAGCGALCPAYNRGCYGCFGPMETPNTVALTRQLRVLGMDERASTGASGRSTPSPSRRRERTWLSDDAGRSRADYLARVEGEGAMYVRIRTAALTTCGCTSTSRRGSSRRSCAAAPSPRRPTSPRASAGSARSRTR